MDTKIFIDMYFVGKYKKELLKASGSLPETTVYKKVVLSAVNGWI